MTPQPSPRAVAPSTSRRQRLLANDSDPEDDTLSITAVSSAVNGTVTLSEDKATVTYAHDGSETTSGSFTYTVSDGGGRGVRGRRSHRYASERMRPALPR